MAITSADVLTLTAPFVAQDHEFNRGFIYISEEAICQRIEAVDPSWEWRVEDMTFENDMATVVGVLTICGVKRYGTGQQLAQIDKNGKESVGESRKGATTDAMKRAARLFGIGRYLLQCPKDIKGHGKELNAWLKSLSGGQAAPQTPVSRPAQPSTSAPVQTPATAPSGAKSTAGTILSSKDPDKWPAVLSWAKERFSYNEADVNAILAPVMNKGVYEGERVTVIARILASAGNYEPDTIKTLGREHKIGPESVSEALLVEAPAIPY